MIEYKVILSDRAEQNLFEIYQFIAQDNPIQAEIFTEKLTETIKKTLSIFPYGMGNIKIGKQIMRRYPYKGYNAFYKVIESEKIVNILYILSGSQQLEKTID